VALTEAEQGCPTVSAGSEEVEMVKAWVSFFGRHPLILRAQTQDHVATQEILRMEWLSFIQFLPWT
jgi:hypothetical protein